MRIAFVFGSALLLAGSWLHAADEGGDDLSSRLQRYRQGLAPAAAGRTNAAPTRNLPEPKGGLPEPAAPRELEPGRLAPLPAGSPDISPEGSEPNVAPMVSQPELTTPNSRATAGPRRVSVLRKDEEAAANAPARVAALPPGVPHHAETPVANPPATPAELSAPTAKAATPFSVAPERPLEHAEEPDSSRRTAALPKTSQTVTPRTPVKRTESKPANETLFAQRGAALSVETIGPKKIAVGKPVVYTLKLQNSGASVAEEVVVFAAVPTSAEVTEIRGSIGQARVEAVEQGVARLKWTIDRLAPQAEEQLTLSLVARTPAPITLEAGWMCKPAYVQTPIAVVEPRLTVAVAGPRELNFGDTKVYVVTLTNPGSGDADNVTVQLVPTSASQPSADANRIGTLKAGEQKQLELELTAREAGGLAIRVNATADGGLQCSAEEQVTVRRGKLHIVASAPQLAFAGTVAEYVVKVQNLGDAPVDKVAAAAILPPGAKFQANIPGATFDAARGRLSWNVGLLPPGTEKTLTIPCQLHQPGANRLDIQAAAGDLTTTGAAVAEVESLADLKLTVDDPSGPVAVGAETSYTIRLVNRGTKAADRIDVRAIFSDGVEPVNVGGGRAELTKNMATFATVPKIAPGQEVVLTVSARATRGGNHVFRAEIDCRDPETKLVSQQTTRFYGGDTRAAAPSLAPPSGPAAPRPMIPDPRVGIMPRVNR